MAHRRTDMYVCISALGGGGGGFVVRRGIGGKTKTESEYEARQVVGAEM